ncbi:tetratricopeptide repeat-containing sulfotransferase family protein [Methylomonas fluvii]|uniref:Sulfotransferase n=1 Tax=Methylomonas fluvii TaxID=1854564 RepID=A0ABR9DH97_9GAMM|nr:sulfotransferase [Methylomonas fluvii]MBD9362476.1 sulfotransferase [Methylomonas fluvii]
MAKNISILNALEKEIDRQLAKLPDDAIHAGAAVMKKRCLAGYLRIGKKMAEIGHPEDSLPTFRKALQLQPDDPDANYQFLFKLEKLNRIDEAWSALQVFEDKYSLPTPLYSISKKLYILKARLEYRKGNTGASRNMLEKFLKENPVHSHRAMACGWLGKMLDSLGEYDLAMKAFHEYNLIVSGTPVAVEMIRKNNAALADIETSLRWYGDKASFGWQGPMVRDYFPQPIVLVGFPRSGTTLLDQILNSHSALTTIEEKSTLANIAKRFYGSQEKLESLYALSGNELSACRQTYWSNATGFLEKPLNNSRLVDKLPLNIMLLDIYARLFPEVKIIVALRDPRDVVLSNYMQMYQLTPEMAANLTLIGSTKYYAKVMQLYLLFRKFMPGNIHEIRYEDLVCDIKGESIKLLGFLGLEWECCLESYYGSAKDRYINTPSYDQVTKPIYHDAIGRWKNYERHLEEIKPILLPFVEAFGYSA